MNVDVAHWFVGRLSGAERIWSSVGPALLLLAYFGLSAIAYGLSHVFRGRFRDEEMDARVGGLTSVGLRHFFAWTMRPWWTLLARVRFPPNAITSLSMAVAAGAGIGVAAGRFALGGWLFVTAGVLDFLDGRVARGSGQVTAGGAALDSILDRYVESAFIVGLAWYYRHDWVLVVCLLALTGSLLVPYVRARGESLGVTMKDVGFMQRPERVLVLGGGTALSPVLEVLVDPVDPHPEHWLAIFALLVLAAASHGTALQRMSRLLTTLDGGRRQLSVARPLKTLGASAIATGFDLVVATAVLAMRGAHPSAATAVGCAAGAVVAFLLCRSWAFEAGGSIAPQLRRYAFVSASGAALNAGGVALLSLLDAPFLLAWGLTRALVFATWSYPVQRDFVFAPRGAPVEPVCAVTFEAAAAASAEPKSRPGLPNPTVLRGGG